MPPKKRDRDTDSSKSRSTDQYQADHELFLNAFEKPTQIYRFLRTRNMISPIFLTRTLTYMKQRMSRGHRTRKSFKVNSLLERIQDRCQGNQVETLKGYMTLTFLGFYDKTITSNHELARVETSVTKISHKKRKDSSSPLVKLFVGTSEVPINPSDEHPPTKAPIISIPSESFNMNNMNNGNVIKSYVLYLRVMRAEPGPEPISINGSLDPLEPMGKRPKPTREDLKHYGSELTVYDKHNRCLLMTGDYELGLQELQGSNKDSPKKPSQWVTINTAEDEAFELLSKGPMIKFRLDWTTEPSSGWVDRPKPFRPNGQNLDVAGNKENRPERSTPAGSAKGKTPKAEPPRLQIVYQFLYNNNSRQQTEACDDLICPWCSLNCDTLYSLLKHLKLCHSRFTFTYNQIPQGARIDVAINECYDGSYTGSPLDLITQPPGLAFSRNGPVRRTTVTHVLVCRPKRPRPSLAEFLELEETEFDGQRPFITGHNRLYHHTTTCLPVYPKEMDVDSEGENDPKWLQQKTIMMIDDFTDVNEGEKELMKLWNLHVMKHGYVGDCQIPLACLMFLQSKGEELLRKNLYRNFVLHVSNLFDFGLISSSTLYMIVRQVHASVKKNPEAARLIQNTWLAQRANWLSSGGQGGSQDKAGSKFIFYPMQTEANPKLTSSSTFISGDGTLRRKMTTQTPNVKTLKQEKEGRKREEEGRKREEEGRKREEEGRKREEEGKGEGKNGEAMEKKTSEVEPPPRVGGTIRKQSFTQPRVSMMRKRSYDCVPPQAAPAFKRKPEEEPSKTTFQRDPAAIRKQSFNPFEDVEPTARKRCYLDDDVIRKRRKSASNVEKPSEGAASLLSFRRKSAASPGSDPSSVS